MDCSPPGSSVHGISQAIIPEWVAIYFSSRSSDPGIKPRSPAMQAIFCIAGRFFTNKVVWEALTMVIFKLPTVSWRWKEGEGFLKDSL